MNIMLKSLTAEIFICLLATTLFAANSAGPAIIPLPQKMECHQGVFQITPASAAPGVPARPATKILADGAIQKTGRYLAAQLRLATGYELEISPTADAGLARGNILLTTNSVKTDLGAEGYELTVAPDSITIRARDSAGLFYGVQSLLQLLPPWVVGSSVRAIKPQIPCVHIEDQPRFKWRGMMLDVSRHFFPKEEVEQILDAMAAYKLNTFHWHLADDQGWRIEIEKYPLLTKIGAWRKGIGFGLDPKASGAYGPDGRYGGFYTRADIREVVAYAQARNITIVPEIEMPGHASAALAAYPQYSCTGGPFTADLPGGVFNGIYCAGNDDSFVFLQNVLAEVFELFPGKYIHIGGDEVLTNNWKDCVKCQARLKAEGLKKESELEGYFIRRMEKFINAHQRSLIGWSEIREGGLARNAAVMDWAGGAVEAASAGHDVVMSPLADCYFDHYQSQDHSTEPYAIGGYLPLQQVYSFEPIPAGLSPAYQGHIVGAQANLWTEYMPSLKHVEYMLFPRLCALAEVAWSSRTSRDWDDFKRRLEVHYLLLDELGINYRHNPAMARAATDSK